MKRFFCIFLTLVLIFNMLPLQVLAEEFNEWKESEPAAESGYDEVSESATESIAESNTETVMESAAEPGTLSATEPATEAATEPATEAATEPSTGDSAEPTEATETEAVTEPTTVQETEFSTEPTTEFAAEATEPAEYASETEPEKEFLASGQCGSSAAWSVGLDGILTISGVGAIDNYSESAHAPWYDYRDSIMEVLIDDGITGIGTYAFQDLFCVKSVAVPDSVTSIGEGAFKGWNALEEITLPFVGCAPSENSVKQLNSFCAIFGRTLSTSSKVPEGLTYQGHAEWAYGSTNYYTYFYLPASLRKVTITNMETIRASSFFNCTTLQEIVFGEKVSKIGSNAFRDCTGLTSVTLTENITAIGSYAFDGCTGLTRIEIPGTITEFGERAFQDCTGLSDIVLKEGLTAIGNYVFSGCTRLTQIQFPSTLTTVGEYAFNNCGLTQLIIPETIKRIEDGAFSGVDQITAITIPDSVEYIGAGAFYGMNKLEEITLPFAGCSAEENTNRYEKYRNYFGVIFGTTTQYSETVTNQGAYYILGTSIWGEESTTLYFHIPSSLRKVTISGPMQKNAFNNCANLETVVIADGITHITEGAFSGCSGLKNIELPESITEIGNNAFAKCTGLTSLPQMTNVTTLGNYAFNGCTGILSINLPDNLKSVGDYAFQNIPFAELSLPEGLERIGNGAFQGNHAFTSLYIPQTVTSVGSGSFKGWNSLEYLSIAGLTGVLGSIFGGSSDKEAGTTPQGRHDSGPYAGYYSGYYYIPDTLRTVVVHGSVGISEYAFENCANLTNIILADGIPSIGEFAFQKCTGLTELYLPEGITTISQNTFNGTNLTYIGVPDSMTDFSGLEKVQNVTWLLYPESDAEAFALDNDIPYEYHNSENTGDLTVKLHPDGKWEDYDGLKLEAFHADSCISLTISDVDQYMFPMLPLGAAYKIRLVNAYGDVLAQCGPIMVTRGQNTITLPKPLPVTSVVLGVRDENNTQHNSHGTIRWIVGGRDYAIGAALTAVPVGTELTAHFTPNSTLLTSYVTPEPVAVTASAEQTQFGIKLTPRQKHTISGTIKDTEGTALAAVSVTATQWLDGKNKVITTVLTDENGGFSLQICSGSVALSTSLTVYEDFSRTLDDIQQDMVLEPIALKELKGMQIDLTVNYQDRSGQRVAITDWKDLSFTVTAGDKSFKTAVQNNALVVLGDVPADSKLRIRASSRSGAFAPGEADVSVGSSIGLSAEITLLEYGKIQADYSDENNPRTRMLIYDTAGNLAWTGLSDGSSSMISAHLSDGAYTVILMGTSDFLAIPAALSDLGTANLTEGKDYRMAKAVVTAGSTTVVSLGRIPKFDETRFYYTKASDSYMTLNKASVTAGQNFTVKASAVLEAEYAQAAENFKWIFDYSDGCVFLDRSLTVANGAATQINIDETNKQLTVKTVDPTSLVRFCLTAQEPGTAYVTAWLEFTLEGEIIRQPVGSQEIIIEALSFSVPGRINTKELDVSGTAPRNSQVELYDNGVKVGQTQANAAGSWVISFALYKPYTYSEHTLYARFTLPSGVVVESEEKKLIYQQLENPVTLAEVHMKYYGYTTIFDLRNGVTKGDFYVYRPGDDVFSFLVYFDSKDLSKVQDVVLDVLLSNGKTSKLYPEWNEAAACWAASARFTESALPVNVNVGYDIDSDLVFSREALIDKQSKIDTLNDIITKQDGSVLDAYDELEAIYKELIDSGLFPEKEEGWLQALSDLQEQREALEQAMEEAGDAVSEILKDATITDKRIVLMFHGFRFDYVKDYTMTEAETKVLTPRPTDNGDIIHTGNMPVDPLDGDDSGNTGGGTDAGGSSGSGSNPGTGSGSGTGNNPGSGNGSGTGGDSGSGSSPGGSSGTGGNPVPPSPTLPPSESVPTTGPKFNQTFYDESLKEKISLDMTASNFVGLVNGCAKIMLAYEKLDFQLQNNIKNLELHVENANKGIDGCRKMSSEFEELAKKALQEDRLNDAMDYMAKGKAYDELGDAVEIRTAKPRDFAKKLGLLGAAFDAVDLVGNVVNAMESETLYNKVKNTAAESEAWRLMVTDKAFAGLSCASAVLAFGAAAGCAWATAAVTAIAPAVIIVGAIAGLVYLWHRENTVKKINKLAGNSNYGQSHTGGFVSHRVANSVLPLVDPSGYVYEAVDSNRISGVTATCYQKQILYDMYDEPYDVIQVWDAASYDQINPQITNGNGQYGWDVPDGLWQVVYEKEGYETAHSDWLEVPPPRFDVNIGIVSKAVPEFAEIRAAGTAVDVTFSKYMKPASLSGALTVTADGKTVDGTWELINEEVDPKNENQTFVSHIRFVPADALEEGTTVTVTAGSGLRSYANVAVPAGSSGAATVISMPESMTCTETVEVLVGGSQEIIIQASPAKYASGKTVRLSCDGQMAALSAQSVTLDRDGKATIAVTGILPGTESVSCHLEGSDLNSSVRITIHTEKLTDIAKKYYQVVSKAGVQLRREASEKAAAVATLYPPATLAVTRISEFSDEIWGYGTTRDGISGWMVISNSNWVVEGLPVLESFKAPSKISVGLQETCDLTEFLTTIPDPADTSSLKFSSSKPAVAQVDADTGILTAKKTGSATITITEESGKKVKVKVSVVKAPSKVTLDMTALTLGAGDNAVITAKLPSKTASRITWTTGNASVAQVADGRILAVGPGKTVITAHTFNGVTASCNLTVLPAPSGFDLLLPETSVGISAKLEAQVLLPEGTAATVHYQSTNPSVAKVDENGKITAVAKGQTTITATTHAGVSRSQVLTVMAKPSKVTMTASTKRMGVGQEYQFAAEVNVGAAGPIVWSTSNKKIATVTEEGLVVAVKPGSVKITAKAYNRKAASVTIKVSAAPEQITLNESDLILGAVSGNCFDTAQLMAALPKKTYSAVTWTTDAPAVATVEDGLVTGLKPGVATITAKTYNGKIAQCNVTVKEAPSLLTPVTAEVVMGKGMTGGLRFEANEGAWAGTLSFVSSNSKVVAVKGGTVTAKKTGSATVTATTYNGISASVTINVINAPKKVIMTASTKNMAVGEEFQFAAQVNAESISPITWTSSNTKIATVDANGKVTALKTGSVRIKAKSYNNKSVSVTVKVK